MKEGWPRLVVIDPEATRRGQVVGMLDASGMRCRALPALPNAAVSGRDRVQVVIVQAAASTFAAVCEARSAFPRARIIVRGNNASQEAAVEAFRAGADDFIWQGASDAEFAALIRGHVAQAEGNTGGDADDGGLIGESALTRQLRAYIRKLAPSATTVLITGETGTGKEVAAVMLHRLSQRADGPLVAFNCAAIPETLLEGELFGYERGSFSGALSAYPGKLKLADGGTLLLDEIGELSLAGQAKVLRSLETREAYRLGGRVPTRFDVRILASTNRDLHEEMRAGRFREDLYYRIAVARVIMPPLRDRPDDVVPIARHLLERLSAATRRNVRIDDAALERLAAHHWPGNVRELRNALEVALVNASGDRIRARDLPEGIASTPVRTTAPVGERARLLDALKRHGGNKSLAAAELRCSRMTLYRKLARYELQDSAPDVAAVTAHRSVSRDLSQQL